MWGASQSSSASVKSHGLRNIFSHAYSTETYKIIIEIAKMFKTKIKYLPSRPGERFGSTVPNNNAKKILNYSASIDIKDYIEEFIQKN